MGSIDVEPRRPFIGSIFKCGVMYGEMGGFGRLKGYVGGDYRARFDGGRAHAGCQPSFSFQPSRFISALIQVSDVQTPSN
ncbi:MAG TPA: hypothetical protein VKI62_04605 [Bacteroidota bacterium]|nr:hypothetical protein [Bacteroidota bacterium]